MAPPQLSALLAERLAGYRSAFELSCAGLFGSGASVTLEYEDDEDDGAARSPAADSVPPGGASASTGAAVASGSAGATAPGAAGAPVAGAAASVAAAHADEFDEAPTVAALPDAVAVKREVEAALRYIAGDFAQTFNNRLAELARIDPIADAVAPRYEFGPQHIADVGESLFAAVAPLLTKLDSRDLDGARRASIDAWLPLERRIREKWQSYFVFTFQDLSVELKAERDRKRIKSSRVDKAAVEALATSHAARDALSDFAAPRTWERPPTRSTLSPWLAVVALLALAAAGGWLLAHSVSHRSPAGSSNPR